MKYDIYRGTKKDMEESGGDISYEKCDKTQVRRFCAVNGFDVVKFLAGDYMVGDNGCGFWLEKVM
jgi:hypothetical protein